MIRAIIYLAITVVVSLGTMTVCSAQNPSDKAKNKKNTIELFMPISHFFDGTRTNWFLLIKISPNSAWTHPGTLGFRYKRKLTNKGELRLSVLAYYMDYIYTGGKVSGETIFRSYTLFSMGYSHKLREGKSSSVYALIEANYRYGQETFHILYPNSFEGVVGSLALKDIGLTAGIRAEQSLPLNFIFLTEVKYTYFVKRYQKEYVSIDLEKPKRASPNVLTINLGLGYRF